ncbi:AraC family transcriptional regulator [Caballeronia mineralivorans]|jgi:AraC-like DNA-binding protein|uniref:AraC family transcriptional regulator n=1 Tax=Caballeronia mineralivorans TaxID=2010198 RepID=UPI0023EF85F6|nr:AraC family transcriptional regulator [Caballeronia mineralivorans]MDB5784810.1 AraC family transcriptional regulator [Caballeronia mineralivorans]MEA3104276.1 AraC family transcriptional regulator, alkane utilization regulator [Caballeronia mineralivorans]MEA3133298.1 AraC family transcriptional regulator, alkane utilization regulator [Gammaproteobacteria bacterium]
MDALSDVLRVVRLSGAVYLNGDFTTPWCLFGQADAALCAAFLPGSERVISYHLITEGSCSARLADDPGSAIHLNAGELLVVPQGEAHIFGSALDLSPALAGPLLAIQLETTPGQVMTLSYGGGGTPTRVVCGFLACDGTLGNPLLSSLPRLFKIDMRNDPQSAWLESSLRFAVAEAAQWRAGSAIVLARLSELLFVEAVRRCIDTLPADRKGWLAGVRDRFVGPALSMLHAQPAHSWTVDELARKVGLSRSALAQRFTDLLGQPPMQYLARWRLQIASHELLIGSKSLAALAEQVGYDSEAAFNRAFKREFGMPPAAWRKSHMAQIDNASTNAAGPVGEMTSV